MESKFATTHSPNGNKLHVSRQQADILNEIVENKALHRSIFMIYDFFIYINIGTDSCFVCQAELGQEVAYYQISILDSLVIFEKEIGIQADTKEKLIHELEKLCDKRETGKKHFTDEQGKCKKIEFQCLDLANKVYFIGREDITNIIREQELDIQKKFIDKIPYGIAIYNLSEEELLLEYINKEYSKMLGISMKKEDSLPKNIMDFEIKASDRSEIKKAFQNSASKNTVFSMDISIYSDQLKRYRKMNLKGIPFIKDEKNTDFLVSLTDIDELAYTKALLQRGHDVLSTAMSSAGMYFFEYDPDTHIAKRINLGNQNNKKEEYENFPECFIKEYAPDQIQLENVRKYFYKMERGSTKEEFECKIVVANQQRWFRTHLLLDPVTKNSNKKKISCLIIDITFQKESEQAYKRHLDLVMRMNPNAVSTFRLNLSKNICEHGSSIYPNILFLQNSGTAEGYVLNAVSYIREVHERWQFLLKFRPENLLDAYHEGNMRVSMRHSYLVNDKDLRLLETIVEMIKNPETGDIEAIVCAIDQTEDDLDEQVQKILLGSEYENIGLIYTKKDQFSIRYYKDEQEVLKKDEEKIAYSFARKWAAVKMVAPEDGHVFMKNTSLKHIQKQLEERGGYFHTFHSPPIDGKRRLKKLSYYYLDKKQGIILSTIEDVTKVLNRDVLTGEYNRTGFLENAARLLTHSNENEKFAMLYLNIRGFKAINELFGIDSGDDVLRQMLLLLENSSLEPLICARTEADHFAALVKRENVNLDELTELCHHVYKQNGKRFYFYWRCGIYLIDDKTISITGMCDRAKIAESFIQDDYVKPYAVFDQSMQEVYVTQKELASDLKSALDNNEFQVYYQPIISVKTGKIASAEALIRWVHPKLGIIFPSKFVPTFEENGYISQLDLFVEMSVRQFLEERYEAGKKIVPVAVNLSRMDFYNNQMIETIICNLESSNLPKEFSRFEVTESAYSALERNGNEMLETLKSLGAKIMVDDFGSGYSSFSTIRDFNFDIIKLDMGFVQQIGKGEKAEWIIHSIIEMAHNLKAEVVAEGVETEEQAYFLMDQGCDYLQGYFFHKPLIQSEFATLLNDEQMREKEV